MGEVCAEVCIVHGSFVWKTFFDDGFEAFFAGDEEGGDEGLVGGEEAELGVAGEDVVDICCAAAPVADDEDRVFGDFCFLYFFVVFESFLDVEGYHEGAEGEAVGEACGVAGADVEVVLG